MPLIEGSRRGEEQEVFQRRGPRHHDVQVKPVDFFGHVGLEPRAVEENATLVREPLPDMGRIPSEAPVEYCSARYFEDSRETLIPCFQNTSEIPRFQNASEIRAVFFCVLWDPALSEHK